MSTNRQEALVRIGNRTLAAALLVWAGFHIYVAGFGNLQFYQQRSIHAGGALIFGILLWGYSRQPKLSDVEDDDVGAGGVEKPRKHLFARLGLRTFDWLLALCVFVGCAYVFVNQDELVRTLRFANDTQRYLAVILLLAALFIIYRVSGAAFVVLLLVLFAYAMYGNAMPGPLRHAGMTLDRALFEMYLGRGGIFGSLTGISANLVTIFIIFGVLLLLGGGGATLTSLANFAGGKVKGGAAQSAVLASGFMGMINGSATANVAATGSITIPLMKRLGMNRNYANGTEAVASLGGQFLPPVMGPGAFLVAEIMGISYLVVMVGSLAPSLLYYLAVMFGLYLYASRENLQPLPPELIPSIRTAFSPYGMLSLIVPIGLLIGLMVNNYTTQRAGYWATVGAILFVITNSLRGGEAGIGIGSLTEQKSNISVEKESRGLATRVDDFKKFWVGGEKQLIDGVSNLVYVAVIIVAAQLVVTLVNTTGLGLTLGSLIMRWGGESLFLGLLLAAVITTILSLGMPTPAAYAIGAAVAAAPLVRLGVQPLAVHLFIYFMACLGAVTPPAMPSIYAAVAIGGGSIRKTAWAAIVLGFPVIIIPFAFVYHPGLLLQGDFTEVLLPIATATVGVIACSIGTMGYLKMHLGVPRRLLFFGGGLMMVTPDARFDVLGLVVFAVLVVSVMRKFKAEQPNDGSEKDRQDESESPEKADAPVDE